MLKWVRRVEARDVGRGEVVSGVNVFEMTFSWPWWLEYAACKVEV